MDLAQEAFVLTSTHTLRIVSHSLPSDDANLESQLQRFWDLEALSIEDHESSVYDEFVKKILFKNGHYEVQVPWKEPHHLTIS